MEKWYKKWWGIIIIFGLLFIASFIVASLAYIYRTAQEINWEKENIMSAERRTEIQKLAVGDGTNYWLGTSTPEVTIVEFSDFACPYCANSFITVRDLGEKYKDEIKIIFRNFLGHDDSQDLAMAAACAGEQNKFWEMHDKLFLQQGQITKTDYPNLAKQLNLDTIKFNTCITNNKYAAIFNKDMSDAIALGATSTPTWFINGYKVKGEIQETDFINLIDQLLK
jgi:protein-disulfide isomerase